MAFWYDCQTKGPSREEYSRGLSAQPANRIAQLTGRADTASNGRFKRDNHELPDQMRLADRDAWVSVEHRLADRELREGQ